VNLYILPYNFRKLFSLLSSAAKYPPEKIAPAWTAAFLAYLKETPCYYWHSVRNGMSHVNLAHLWPIQANVNDFLGEIYTMSDRLVSQARLALERIRAGIRETLTKQQGKKKRGDLIENVFDIPLEDMAQQLQAYRLVSAMKSTDHQKRNKNLKSLATQEELGILVCEN
jgi:hypothetical protein